MVQTYLLLLWRKWCFSSTTNREAVPQCQDLLQFVFPQHTLPKFTRQARASTPHSLRGFPSPHWSSPLRTDPLGNNRPTCSSRDSNVPSQTWENPNPSQNKLLQSKAIAKKKREHQVSSSVPDNCHYKNKKVHKSKCTFPLGAYIQKTCFHSFDFKQSSQEKSWAAHSQAPQKDWNWSSYIAFPWVLKSASIACCCIPWVRPSPDHIYRLWQQQLEVRFLL